MAASREDEREHMLMAIEFLRQTVVLAPKAGIAAMDLP